MIMRNTSMPSVCLVLSLDWWWCDSIAWRINSFRPWKFYMFPIKFAKKKNLVNTTQRIANRTISRIIQKKHLDDCGVAFHVPVFSAGNSISSHCFEWLHCFYIPFWDKRRHIYMFKCKNFNLFVFYNVNREQSFIPFKWKKTRNDWNS